MKDYHKKKGWLFRFGTYELRMPYDGKEYETAQAMADALPSVMYELIDDDHKTTRIWAKRPTYLANGNRKMVSCAGTKIPAWHYSMELQHGQIGDLDPEAWDKFWESINV